MLYTTRKKEIKRKYRRKKKEKKNGASMRFDSIGHTFCINDKLDYYLFNVKLLSFVQN